MHGTPLADAMVSFAPRSSQPTAVGRTNQTGEYTLTTYEPGDGAAAGDYAVVVSKVVAAPPVKSDAGHSADPFAADNSGHGANAAAPESVLMVPPQYSKADQTPLKATVSADGENRFDFEIQQ
jgi:hypothetical protein